MAADDELRGLRDEVARLASRVERLESAVAWARAPPPTAPPVAAPAPTVLHHARPAPAARRDVERLLGEGWLGYAGAFVLVLGIGFFLKYAFEHDWIGLTARILLGVVAGASLVATGEILARRRGYGRFPQILAGAGAAIMYFSVFSAYAFEEYRAATGFTATGALLALTFLAVAFAAYAAWRQAPILASLGVALACTTGVLAGLWTELGATYTLVIAVAVAGVTAARGWPHVALLGAAGSVVTLLAHVAAADRPGAFVWPALLVVVVYGAAAYAASVRGVAAGVDARFTGVLAAVATLGGWLVAVLAANVPEGRTSLVDAAPRLDESITVAVTAAALTSAYLARRASGHFAAGAAVAGAITLLAAPPLAFEAPAAAVAWAFAALAGVYAAGRPRLSLRPGGARFVAVAVAVAAGLSAWAMLTPSSGTFAPDRAIVTFVAYLVSAVALAVAWRATPAVAGRDLARRVVLASAIVAPTAYFGYALEGYGISASWAVLGLALVGAGFAWKERDLRLAAFAVFAFMLGRLFLVDLATLDLGYRIVAFIVVGGVLLLGSFLYARNARRAAPPTDAEVRPFELATPPPR